MAAGQDVAEFGGDEAAELVGVGADGHAYALQQRGAFHRGGGAPAREGALGGRQCVLHVSRRGYGQGAEHGVGAGVEAWQFVAAAAAAPLAGDKETDSAHPLNTVSRSKLPLGCACSAQ